MEEQQLSEASLSPSDLSADGRTVLQHQPPALALPVLLVLSDRPGRTSAARRRRPALLCHAAHGGCGVPGEYFNFKYTLSFTFKVITVKLIYCSPCLSGLVEDTSSVWNM